MFQLAPMAAVGIFLVSTMLAIGMTVSREEISSTLRDRRTLPRVLVANFILVPLLGIVLTHIFHFPAGTTTGILLLAISPGGLTAIQFTDKVKGSLAFAAVVAFVLTIASIAASPIIAHILIPLESPVRVPYFPVVGGVLLFLLLPVVLGFLVRRSFPIAAGEISKILLALSNLSFIASIVLTLAYKRQTMKELGPSVTAALLILIVGSMVIGWLLGGAGSGQPKGHGRVYEHAQCRPLPAGGHEEPAGHQCGCLGGRLHGVDDPPEPGLYPLSYRQGKTQGREEENGEPGLEGRGWPRELYQHFT
jgi:predicted Na+-dependent transporter